MPFFTGLGMTASMIVALGPQNAYLIKHGLLRHTAVLRIAAIYIAIDVALIALGALGVGAVIGESPDLRLVFSVLAAMFFFVYGIMNIRKAFKKHVPAVDMETGKSHYSTAVLVSIANPGVLFDTVVLVGGLAGQYDLLADRLVFSAGAATASLLWFSAIAALSFYVGYYVTSDKVWRVLDLVIGSLMIMLAGVILNNSAETMMTSIATISAYFA